ncbi:MAG TPA: hypothetical protein VGI93_04875 [Steroidobacteraceae bacterium]
MPKQLNFVSAGPGVTARPLRSPSHPLQDLAQQLHLARAPWPPTSAQQVNAVIGSLVIHSRTLIFFFYPSNLQDTDVIARDFIDGVSAWSTPKITDELDRAMTMANKEVGHLIAPLGK